MLQNIQVCYAPNEPNLHGRQQASDLETLLHYLDKAPTTAMIDSIVSTLLEFIRAFGGNSKVRLIWTNSEEDWQDLVADPLIKLGKSQEYSDDGVHARYVAYTKVRLLNDILAEERVSGKNGAPASFHSALLNHCNSHQYKSIVTKVYNIIAPQKKEDNLPGATEYASKKIKRGAKLAKATASIAASQYPNAMDTDPTPSQEHAVQDESWMQLRQNWDELTLKIRVVVVELLQNLASFLHAKFPQFVAEIDDGFKTISDDNNRVFFLTRFEPPPPMRIAFLDLVLMGSFERGQAAVVKKSTHVAAVGGIQKLLDTYWDLRPIAVGKREKGTEPRSNWLILCTCLLQMLDALDFPKTFTHDQLVICRTKAQHILGEANGLASRETIFTAEEIQRGVEAAQDLYNFVSCFVE